MDSLYQQPAGEKNKRQLDLCADAVYVIRKLEDEHKDLEKVKNILHIAVTLATEEIQFSRRKR